LPFPTLGSPGDLHGTIKGLAFGWFDKVRRSSSPLLPDTHERVLPVICWAETRERDGVFRGGISPSQMWEWGRGMTLGDMLDESRSKHEALYGPGGQYHTREQVGLDVFMRACEGVSRFLLAGLAWLNQKVLVDERPHLERHRRKEFERKTQRPFDGVRVVHLRRRESPAHERPQGSAPVEWSHRWLVDGHWRNQPCGPQMQDRKLTWIAPFVKGPDDKPFKAKTPTVFEVDR
jgi:hypothetical protein